MAEQPTEHVYVPIGEADSEPLEKPRLRFRQLLAVFCVLLFLFLPHKRGIASFLEASRRSHGVLKIALFSPYLILCLCSFVGLVYVHMKVIKGHYSSQFGFRVSVAIAVIPWLYLAPLLFWLSE